MTRRSNTALDPADAVYDDITKTETTSGVHTGIRVRLITRHLVPIYEEHAARVHAGYNLREWDELTPMEKAIEIAVYRIDRKIEEITADANIQDSKRNR